jgi:hypothetical protein
LAGRPPTRKPPSRKADARQQRLPLDATFKERHQLLDAVTPERSGLSRAAWANVVALLRAVHECGEECWASVSWLTDRSGLPARTLHRARAAAIELGLLLVESRYNRVGRTTSVWRVDWLSLAQLDRRVVKAPSPGPSPQVGGEKWPTTACPVCPTGECHCGTGECHSGRGECHNGTHNKDETLSLISQLTSTPHPPTGTPASALDRQAFAWRSVVEEVDRRGINQATAACAAAREGGSSPAEVLAVLAHWDAHRSGWEFSEAALYHRLRRLRAGEDATRGWPAWRRGYRVATDEAAERERKSANAEAWSQRQRELAEADERNRQALAARRRAAREGVA